MTRLSDFPDPPSTITTAEQALARASKFLIQYGYRINRPVYVRRDGEQWKVEFDVSILGPKQTIRLTIDSQSGAISVLQDHVIHSRQYLENALIALQDGEADKAGELLWGSVAQAIRAVALSKNRSVKTHRELKNFVLQLARDLEDKTLETNFLLAESLHHNFYTVQQESEDIAIVLPAVQELVRKLIYLIPPELLEQRGTT